VPDPTAALLHEVALEVFASMVRRPLTERPTGAPRTYPRDVAGTVAFDGSLTGYVSVVTSQQAARTITASLLETEPNRVDGQLKDAIGEVANMVTGSLRTRMAKPGDAWATTTPVTRLGHDLTVEPSEGAAHIAQSYLIGNEVLDIHLIVTGRR
jgi:chemotaxis protein CheX